LETSLLAYLMIKLYITLLNLKYVDSELILFSQVIQFLYYDFINLQQTKNYHSLKIQTIDSMSK
jgi:hypothetical protein